MTEAQLYAPFTHVAGLKSKNLRDDFIDALNDVLLVDAAHVHAIKQIVQKLHNASLLLDDIEDAAPRRRGLPSAHMIFGIPLTMNAANIVIFDVLGECIQLEKALSHRPNPTLVEIFQEELALLHRGQGQDIFWRDTNHCPTMAEYREMVQNKTGGLFRLALRLLAACAPALPSERRDSLISVVDEVSYFFQVLDDMMNLCSSDYHEKKTFCEDLTEGKFSFLTTHSVIKAKERGDERLLRVLQTRPASVDVKMFCLQLLRETGTFDFTRQHLDALGRDILAHLDKMKDALVQASPIEESSERLATPNLRRFSAFMFKLTEMIPQQDNVPPSPLLVASGVPVTSYAELQAPSA